MNSNIQANSCQFIGYNFLFLTLYLAFGLLAYFFLDKPTAYFFYNLSLPPSLQIAINIVNDLGLGWFYIVGFPLAALIAIEYFKRVDIARAFVFLWLCVLFSGLVCDIIKPILARARPEEFLEYNYYGFYFFKIKGIWNSFPSGHTTVITAIMFGLSYLKPRWTFLFLLIAFVISSMRIVLTQHYISDVMAGFYISLVCVHILHAFYKKKGYNLPQF